MSRKFYAITTFSKIKPKQHEGPLPPESFVPSELPGQELRFRTVGIFESQEHAVNILEKNIGDLNEAGWYEWAIVEEFNFGLYPDVDKEQTKLYKYERESDSWLPQPISDMLKEVDYEHVFSIAEIG